MQRLREIRGDRTQQQMADLLGIPRETYRGYETGLRSPSVEVIKAMADTLGVSTDYLLGVESEVCDEETRGSYVRVAVCSPIVKVCAPALNVEEIISYIKSCVEKSVDIVVFPELCITGSTCQDYFLSSVLIDATEQAIATLLHSSRGIDTLITLGAPVRVRGSLYNCAILLKDGEILAVVPKSNMLSYGEYNHTRYFREYLGENIIIRYAGVDTIFGTRILLQDEHSDLTIGVEIGSDLSSMISPATLSAVAGANLILNPYADSDTVGKSERLRAKVLSTSDMLTCAYALAGAGVGESTTDSVYSGYSVMAEVGEVVSELECFRGGLTCTDIDIDYISYLRTKRGYVANSDAYSTIPISLRTRALPIDRVYCPYPFENVEDTDAMLDKVLELQGRGLASRVSSIRAKKLVIGISGGLDSTLALLVCCRALDILSRPYSDIKAITMPCYGTTGRTLNNSIALCRSLGVEVETIDIGKSVSLHLSDIGHEESGDTAYENAQARERTQILMDVANAIGGIVVGTGDLSEIALGWSTYNGDHMSMYSVNCTVPKTLIKKVVYKVAIESTGALRDVLLDILDTPISPELLPAKENEIVQKTEDIIGPYELHDYFLYYMIDRGFSPAKLKGVAVRSFEGRYDEKTIDKWLRTFIRRFFTQQFKRSCSPDGVKVGVIGLSPRADWRAPSDANFDAWLEDIYE